ncbi:synaptonemal complex protein 3 isoform X2 [Micropterus salmoides]|uniref:synaptonemal complex protein 3 isoform X2 n=1 Tax=Micropterus salmoides TaxID=27706 RepID=UPI0018EC7939|nr:synaptonemal complex protein 3 isoform X2 [Micropterus salmoides]
MATARRQMKKKHPEEKPDKKVFDFTQEDEKKELSGSEDDVRERDKLAKKRPAADFEEEASCAVGNEVQSMLEKFGGKQHCAADISKVMQAKKKRLECLTKNYMKGSQHKLEQLWNNYHSQRQKMTQQYSSQVSSALQQWEAEAQRAEEQEEKLNNLFRQQQKILQQARVVQNQKLKTVRELYEQFVKNMEDMENSHEAFLQGAQQELRKEMATLQKKILMDTQQQEMATVRKSLQSMLF